MSENLNTLKQDQIFNFTPGTANAPGIGFMTIGDTFQVSHLLINRVITKSFEDRLLVAEFDDALIDQAAWSNPRYNGCKATGTKINIHTEGDISYGLNPVINNETTAIYIANSVIGGMEDPQFASIRNHSYLNIDKIVVVTLNDDSVQVLDRNVEGFDEFHRFITNDLPTGASFNMMVLDDSVGTNLKQDYKVKMNKGFLMTTFEFNFAGEFSSSILANEGFHGKTLIENNSMYLYKGGEFSGSLFITGVNAEGTAAQNANNANQGEELRFRYAINEMFEGGSANRGNLFGRAHMGPSFASSSIRENKFTRQFFSGSYGFIIDTPTGSFNNEVARNSGLGKASRFIGISCLNFLRDNNADNTLANKDKTELHVTFFEGTKDFAPGANDERSISTFEIDSNQGALQLADHCYDFLPTTHELILKGPGDSRFMPTINTFEDTWRNAYLQATASGFTYGTAEFTGSFGCLELGSTAFNNGRIQPGTNIDVIKDANVYVQGGALGQVGYIGSFSSSNANHKNSISGSMTSDNYYSGSFNYELSFLDKDHVLISDVDKDSELFDGIGTRGVAIIPEFTHPTIKDNIRFYLRKAGLIPQAPGTKIVRETRER